MHVQTGAGRVTASIAHHMIHTKTKGYILGVIAAVTYGLNPLFTLPLYADGMDADSVLLFRYIAAMPIMAAMLLLRGRKLTLLSAPQTLRVGVLGIIMALSSLLLFLSYRYMAAGIASTLLFIYPIIVAALMAICFGEKVKVITVLCIAMACGGIAMLYDGGEEGTTLSLTGTVMVLLSALSYAIYIVGVNRPSLRVIPTLLLTFYLLGFGALLFLGRVVWAGRVTLPQHWWMWLNIVALAVLPTAVSFVCTTKAAQYVGPTVTAILGALEPVTAVVIGIAVFGESLTPAEFLGLVLIVVAVSLVVAGGKVTAPLVRFRKLFPRLNPRR